MARSIEDTIWIAFDTETTGLSAIKDRVVEIGAVKFDTHGKSLGEFQELINPGIGIPPGASAVHGITDVDVHDAPPIEVVLPDFLEFLGTSDNVLIAHNAVFDAGFIGAEMGRSHIDHDDHMILDTLSISRRVKKGIASHSLEYLAKDLEVDTRGHHRALADSVMVKEVFLRLLDRIPGTENLDELLNYTSIYRFTALPRLQAQSLNGFEYFQQAIESETPVLMVYRGGSRGHAPRKITPLGLIETSGHSYIRAYCHIDGVEKEFRIDRIDGFTPLEEEG
jgi:DNA polymerase III epsilon subunit family exonuclease